MRRNVYRYGEGRYPREGFSVKHLKDAHNHFKLEPVKLKQEIFVFNSQNAEQRVIKKLNK